MASSKNYLDFVLDCLSDLGSVSYRAMMGEYILYYNGKIFGGVYDDRLLVKDTPSSRAMMPNAPCELPHKGAKEMLLVEEIEDRDFLKRLVEGMYGELPAAKERGK